MWGTPEVVGEAKVLTSLLTTYRDRVCTCLASPQLARLATDLERGAGLRACVHGVPPTERTSEPPSSRDGEALRDSVSQPKGEL